MNCMLTKLPSGDEVNRSVRTLSLADGAITSVSMASANAFRPSALVVADSVASSARISSRLATLIGVGSSNSANTALIRGSTRGSSASFDAMTSPIALTAHLTRRGSATIQPAAIDHGTHRRIMRQAIGVVKVLAALVGYAARVREHWVRPSLAV